MIKTKEKCLMVISWMNLIKMQFTSLKMKLVLVVFMEFILLKILKEFSKNLIFTDFKIEKSYKSEIFLFLIALFILITILVKKYNSSNKINISREKLVLNIKNFIQNNLNSVTLKMLEDEFDLAYYEINSLDNDFKPAVFIKNSRKIKAQKMFFDKKSMSEIAQKTGYSETYLLKNKTKFINKNYNL